MTPTTNPFDDDKLREECGVFGIFGRDSAAAMTALGLHALQHRGQEAAGIVCTDGEQFNAHHALGHVGENFNAESVVTRLVGNAAIGHTRYATTGETALRNVQPLFADFDFGGFAIAHNGNLTNAHTIRKQLVKRGCLFRSSTDTETFIHLMAVSSAGRPVDRLIEALRQVEGAYSLVCLGSDMMIGVRDPHGVRPLVLGKIDDAHVLASETCALDIIGAEFVRDIEPGEMVVVTKDGVQSMRPFAAAPHKFCIFEYIYFARPDSSVEGRSVYEMRKNIGAELARESHVDADIVVPVPDSGVPSAIGYAEISKLPFDLGIIRNHYVGRTFIQPTDRIRHLGVKLKHNANRRFIEGKRVVLVDDSIVRGTTSVKIVEMLRAAGAREVHMRISSPPTSHSCFYGVDTPEADKLLAHKYTVAEMCKFIGADSLAFISMDGLYRAMGEAKRNAQMPQFCDACFSGDYPIQLTDLNGQTPTVSVLAGGK
ncbi:MAG: amidophosphoribosyltransferase, partial [Alphaproteobacteria bacterium]|nr:amidophosphoribosyltransferase [Alphaproteobacteria bacterium]